MSVQGLSHKALVQDLCKLAQFSLTSKISLHRNAAKYAQKIRKIYSEKNTLIYFLEFNAPEMELNIFTEEN